MTGPQPLDLPRLVMRRAAVVGVLTLMVAALLGLQRANQNIHDEVDAAMTLAGLMARLGHLDRKDDGAALQSVRQVLESAALRHLELRVHAADGRLLLAPPAPTPPPAWLGVAMRAHREWLIGPEHRVVAWQVLRPTGLPWTVTLSASPESERREALTDLLGMLGLLLLGLVALLAVMQWNVRRAFRPLSQLLQAISGIEHRDAAQVRQLPPMPIRELEALAHALRHLSDALDDAEQQRRVLSQKVLTLQEDERNHLARELHDEFGQRLTALRFDAAWLTRRTADTPDVAEVVAGMAKRCAEVQRDIRDLLVRLRPLGPTDRGATDALPMARLVQLLRSLVDSWQLPTGRSAAPRFELTIAFSPEGAAPRPFTEAESEAERLPYAVALTVYRLTQEALTNVAKHAQAAHVRIEVLLSRAAPATPGAPCRLSWAVVDDGCGLGNLDTDMRKGNGLGGMQERVWALGGEWHAGPASAVGRGLRLQANLPYTIPVLTAPP